MIFFSSNNSYVGLRLELKLEFESERKGKRQWKFCESSALVVVAAMNNFILS